MILKKEETLISSIKAKFHKKNIFILICVSTALIALFILIYTSYINPYGVKVHGDFIYAEQHSNEITIVDLSKEGKKRDTLVFPSVIDGKPVVGIGATHPRIWGPNSSSIVIDMATNVYFPSNYVYDYTRITYGGDMENRNIFLGNFEVSSRVIPSSYTPSENYEKDYKLYMQHYYNTNLITVERLESKYQSANVVYYTDDTENSYFVDDVDGGVVNVIPPDPYKEGYSFKGWYKDSQCAIEWDFTNDIVSTKQYDENGNYIFNETKIYAKWE